MPCPFEQVPVAALAGMYCPEPDDPHFHLKAEDGSAVMVSAQTILSCLYALEIEHEVPPCESDWWRLVIRRYDVPLQEIHEALEDSCRA